MQGVLPNGAGDIRGDYSEWLATAGDPAYLVARMNLLFAAGQVSAATVSQIADAIRTMGAQTDNGRRNRIWAAALMVLCSPEYLVMK
jgi:uncharacterized membrane protein